MKNLNLFLGRITDSFFLVVSIVLISFFGANAQNVGIGTQTPDQKLEVDGNIKLGDNLMVEGSDALRIFRNLASYSTATTTAGAFVIHTNIPNSSNCMWTITVKGYVYSSSGLFEVTIGSYNLSGHDGYIYEGDFKLDVRTGFESATNNLVIILGSESDSYGYPKFTVSECRIGHCARNETRADGWSITQETILTSYSSITFIENASDVQWEEDGNDIYYNNGNVGIGTASPNYKLRVDENSGAGSSRAIFGYNLSTATNGFMNGVVGETKTNATVNAGSGVLGINSSTSGNGNGLKGESYGPGSRGVFGKVTHTSGTNYAIFGETASSNGYAGYFEGGKNYFEGNVGIGTANPEEKLHIYGGDLMIKDSYPFIFLDDTSASGNAGIKFMSNSANRAYTYFSSSDSTFRSYNSFSGYTNNLVINKDGKVGIGTTSPEQELHVMGNMKVTSPVPLMILNSSSPIGSSSIMFSQDSTKKSLFYRHDTEKLLIFDYERAEYDLAIDSDGNVGIGTTSPEQELHVIGNMKATDISPLMILNSSSASGSSSIMFSQGATQKSLFYSHTTDKLLIYDYNRSEYDFAITSNGDVGIGTTSPSYKLEVDGDIKCDGDLITGALGGVINAGGARSTSVNVIGDTPSPGYTLFLGDEDLYIEDDLELGGQGYKPGGGSWGTVSDARLKKNIKTYTDGLSTLLKIEPVTYEYSNTLMKNWNTDKRYVGVIAQDIKPLAPYMVEEVFLGKSVSENEDGSETIIDPGHPYLSFNGTALTYMLINSVKEQQEIINTQQGKIDELSDKLDQLTEQVNRLTK